MIEPQRNSLRDIMKAQPRHGNYVCILLFFCLASALARQGALAAQSEAPSTEDTAPGLEKEQPKRRRLNSPPLSEEEKTPLPEEPAADEEKPKILERSSPIPPYPNYPESILPKPPRTPRQQEYLYLNHLYFDPLSLAIGGFISFGWIALISSGKAIGLGLDIYSPRTNLSIVLQNKQDDPVYNGVVAMLLRFGFHFFPEPNQLKGFDFGLISRTGIIISTASGNSVTLQESLELSFAYRFVISLFSRNGRPSLNIGIAPYIVFSISGFFSTSGTVGDLRNTDDGFDEYLTAGNLITEPSVINNLSPISLRLSFRFGVEVSMVF